MDLWLIRTSNNLIAGPFSKTQLVQQIEEGRVGMQDEACQANHYWFFFHESQEVQRQLGIQMPRVARHDEDEDITETQTDQITADGSEAVMAPPLQEKPRIQVRAPYRPILISPQIERPSIWRGFAWLLTLAACLVVYAVLRVLRAP